MTNYRELVEDGLLTLLAEGNVQFRRYLEAMTDEDSVEGDMFADDVMATKMIRDAAPQGSPLKDVQLAGLVRVLATIMPRYGFTREHTDPDDADEEYRR